jgi:bifunctional DNA-binding transcriptional regulator/antitoxin component of YhaV-PrlF toxin-antitoxin module
MPEVTLDDQGRLTLPEGLRKRYGDRYRVVEKTASELKEDVNESVK